MKNVLYVTAVILFLIPVHLNVKAQFVLTGKIDSIATDTFQLCKGDVLDLNSSKSDYLMNNDFNNSTVGSGWSTNVTALWTNPCPPDNLPAQGVVLWLGSNTFPRELITVGYDIHCYNFCNVEFDMKYGANQNSLNCESPDLPTEGVHLMYSVTGGPPWTQFSGGYWTPTGNAAIGPFYSWNHYNLQLPVSAISYNTKIRWYQDLASGNNYDHWGIDNVKILCPIEPYIEWRCPEKPAWHYYDFNPPPFIADEAGTFHYIVTIIDLIGNNECEQSDTIVVIVHDPKVNAIPDLEICFGDTAILTMTDSCIDLLSCQWNTIPVTNSEILVVFPTITTMYTVTVKDSIGCTAKDSVLVTVHPLPVIITTSDTICIGDTAIISASAGGNGDTYLWSNGYVTASVIVTPAFTSTYQLTVATQFGCKDTSSAFVKVNPKPIIQLTNNTTICMESQALLTASGGISYFWIPTGDTIPSVSVSPTIPLTTYKVIVTDINKCIDSSTVDITTIPLPVPTISQEFDTICKGVFATITAGGGTSYLWNTGDITSSVIVRPLSTFIYVVKVSNSDNNIICSKDTSIQQMVRNCNVIYVPNSFSPLGYNAVFKPIGEIVISKTYIFAIYNRWGQKIFETSDINQGWDGRFNGEYVTSGAYIYYINIDNGYEEPYEKTGTVTVIN